MVKYTRSHDRAHAKSVYIDNIFFQFSGRRGPHCCVGPLGSGRPPECQLTLSKPTHPVTTNLTLETSSAAATPPSRVPLHTLCARRAHGAQIV